MKRRVVLVIAAILFSGCAHQNVPINAEMELKEKPKVDDDYTFARWLEKNKEKELPKKLIVLSFSGGGARAATVASGVLKALEKKKGISNNFSIALISSTSGGSVTAATYAAEGGLGLKSLDDQFLKIDNMSALKWKLAPRLIIPGANRTMEFSTFLEEKIPLLKSLRYQDLIKKWDQGAPFIILNATDMSSGRTLEFTQESFSEFCSSLAPLSLSKAVAASAAFPFLLNPLPLQNHWSNEQTCVLAKDKNRKSAKERLSDAVKERPQSPEKIDRARYAYSLEHSGNGSSGDDDDLPDQKIQFVHLLDGGLSDNLAARAVMRILGAHLADIRALGVTDLFIIQVNAKSKQPNDYDQSSAIPGLLDVFWSVTLNPIDVATELSAYSSRLYTIELETATNLEQPKENQIRVFTIPVNFNLEIDRTRRLRAQKIPTKWSLASKEFSDEENFAFLTDEAENLLSKNPCFNFLTSMSSERCDYAKLVEAPTGAQVERVAAAPIVAAPKAAPAPVGVASAPAPAPAPVGVAPAPARQSPTATKVTYAADAFFDFDKSVLKPEGKATLDDLAQKVKSINLEVIIAVGHADAIGTDGYNQKLSMRRSEAVKAYLVSKGIEKNRIYIEGKGKSQPVADNKTSEGRAKNRRVEIEIVGTRLNK